MLDAQSTNALATFHDYDEATGEWSPTVEDVRVYYQPQGTSYVNESSGDIVRREERILAPLSIDNHVDEGDRITLTYRSKTYEWRVTNFRARSLDGVEGYCQLEFEDFGDDDVGDSGGSGDWDMG